jgi:hypothetical protein
MACACMTLFVIACVRHHGSRGRGLGLEFLRHIERTQVLVYVLDACSENGPVSDLQCVPRSCGALAPAGPSSPPLPPYYTLTRALSAHTPRARKTRNRARSTHARARQAYFHARQLRERARQWRTRAGTQLTPSCASPAACRAPRRAPYPPSRRPSPHRWQVPAAGAYGVQPCPGGPPLHCGAEQGGPARRCGGVRHRAGRHAAPRGTHQVCGPQPAASRGH